MPIISTYDIFIRLLLAFLVSGIIGFEREYLKRPAGLRTNIMVGLGATLMTIASVQAAGLFQGFAVDPTRIAAQIVTGIGFLGIGTVLHKGPMVVGLTTAATLWVVAGLGIAIGLGLYMEALITAFFVLFTFTVVSRCVPWIKKKSKVKA